MNYESIDFKKLSESLGYTNFIKATELDELKNIGKQINEQKGSTLVEIIVNTESRADLGRPKTTPKENKELFIQKLNESPGNNLQATL